MAGTFVFLVSGSGALRFLEPEVVPGGVVTFVTGAGVGVLVVDGSRDWGTMLAVGRVVVALVDVTAVTGSWAKNRKLPSGIGANERGWRTLIDICSG